MPFIEMNQNISYIFIIEYIILIAKSNRIMDDIFVNPPIFIDIMLF